MQFVNQQLKIRHKRVPNRFAYQPTESNNCGSNGYPTEVTFAKYEQIAKGKPGIIHLESVDVTPETQARSNRMVLTEETLSGYRELVSRIRKINDESLVIFQLSHGGRLSDPRFKEPVAVYKRGSNDVRILTTEEVQEARDQFVNCAVLSYKAGADGIDFKQAHGFLADDFLHPANMREDQYGGSFGNRIRFFTEAYQKIREEVNDPDFIVGTRLSPFEGISGGCGTKGPDGVVEDFTEMIQFAKELEEMGVDFINVSAGYAAANLELLMPSDSYPEGVPRLFGWTRKLKEAVSIPVIGSGYSYLKDGRNGLFGEDPGKKSLLYFAEENIRQGFVDLIGIGRQSIADPLFADKVISGNIPDVCWCTTCGGCTTLLGNNKQIGCTVYDKKYADLLKQL